MRGQEPLLLAVVMLAGCTATAHVAIPLGSGDYIFLHRFEEHPDINSVELAVQIRGRRIRIVNQSASAVFPVGLVEEGELIWHANTHQWVISQDPAAATANEVGGCSDGPSVIDLKSKVYWTC